MIENNIFLSTIISWQQEINLMISDYFDLLEEGNTTIHFIILAISFLYGLIHAMGPGHGKMVIASYFLAKDSNRKEAFKAGFLTALIHTISALLITGVLYIFFQNTLSGYFQNINQNMYKVSAVFIILIACFLLYESLHDRNKKEEIKPLQNKNIFAIALSIGVVPCPGVMTIVLYAMILGYVTLGIFSAITMSIGMGLTISIAAILASSIKSAGYSRYKKGIQILTFSGIGFLFFLGGALLV